MKLLLCSVLYFTVHKYIFHAKSHDKRYRKKEVGVVCANVGIKKNDTKNVYIVSALVQ